MMNQENGTVVVLSNTVIRLEIDVFDDAGNEAEFVKEINLCKEGSEQLFLGF